MHYDCEVVNLGYPAQGNDIIKKHLFGIGSSDHVFIKFTGYDRVHVGMDDSIKYDSNIYRKNLQRVEYFKSKNASFIQLDKRNTKNTFSNFQLIYNMLEQILDCQNYLEANDLDYTFSTWQNLYNNSKHISLTDQTTISDSQFVDNPAYQQVLGKIKQANFVQDLNNGLWEHLLSNKELVQVQNVNEFHPNCLCHFDYFKKYFKPILDKKLNPNNNLSDLESKARQFSKHFAQLNNTELHLPTEDNTPTSHLEYPSESQFKTAKNHFFKIFADYQ
jgi:hypothetical protein